MLTPREPWQPHPSETPLTTSFLRREALDWTHHQSLEFFSFHDLVVLLRFIMAEGTRLRVGIVGAGGVAQIIHLPTLALMSHLFTTIAICDVSKKVDGLTSGST